MWLFLLRKPLRDNCKLMFYACDFSLVDLVLGYTPQIPISSVYLQISFVQTLYIISFLSFWTSLLFISYSCSISWCVIFIIGFNMYLNRGFLKVCIGVLHLFAYFLKLDLFFQSALNTWMDVTHCTFLSTSNFTDWLSSRKISSTILASYSVVNCHFFICISAKVIIAYLKVL